VPCTEEDYDPGVEAHRDEHVPVVEEDGYAVQVRGPVRPFYHLDDRRGEEAPEETDDERAQEFARRGDGDVLVQDVESAPAVVIVPVVAVQTHHVHAVPAVTSVGRVRAVAVVVHGAVHMMRQLALLRARPLLFHHARHFLASGLNSAVGGVDFTSLLLVDFTGSSSVLVLLVFFVLGALFFWFVFWLF